MFHTFQSTVTKSSNAETGAEGSDKPTRSSGSRRISTSNACVECRRRKIRCDGSQPCGQCQWYQHPEACAYSKPAQRIVPSRKLVEKLQARIDQYKCVVDRLYPSKDIESLATMSREELLDLALSAPAQLPASFSPSGSISTTVPTMTPRSEGGESIDALEQPPPEDPEWDEARKHRVKIQGISDDVNGLSMSVDRPSSYVGISSTAAALKVILKIAPIVRQYVEQRSNHTALQSRSATPPPELVDDSPFALPPTPVGQQLAESYFERCHPFFPMIEERKFWTAYLYGERRDSPWLALLNMVFALGSLASSTSDNQEHYVYFMRSRRHISLESFGSGSLEVLQALGIMSGYYMHYLNRPNEAHSVMGATLRMATALGLHREYSDASSQKDDHFEPNLYQRMGSIPAEMRRRIWWSLFCLDAWASTTTGRPALGRMGPSITVQLPGTTLEKAHALPLLNSPERLKVLPLIHNSEFCRICTTIQDRLIEQPLLGSEEQSQLDTDLVRWHEGLPSLLTNFNEPVPEFLRVPRLVMKWRYQNIRIILHRPTLLAAALHRIPFVALGADEKVAVGKCRIIAGKTIDEIAHECGPDLISGWNAVWFMFQACMVPLVSLFSDASVPDEVEKWRAQVEAALAFFERIKRYSVAADKSGSAVRQLYEAYKAVAAEAEVQAATAQRVGQQQPFEINDGAMKVEESLDSVDIASSMGLTGGMAGIDMWNLTGEDPDEGLGGLSDFWDDMLWDTNFPDMATVATVEHPYGGYGVQDAGDAGCWDVEG